MAYQNEFEKAAAGLLTFGIAVKKASATIPQGGTQDLFVVAGGNVLVELLYGEVTTILGATANNISVEVDPTVASGTTYIIGAVAEGNALEAGAFLVVEGDGTALNIVGKAGAGIIATGTGRWICPVGTIKFRTVASTTGATKWSLRYIPLDDGASVVSA